MNTCEPTNHPPQLEPLSQVALTLAARLAGLIDRTMNLYETELTQAEESHATTTTPESPVPTPKSPTRIPNPDSRIPKPAAPRNTIGNLRALVHSLESLLRSARLARDLEKTAPTTNDPSFTAVDYEALRAFFESDDEEQDEEPKEDIWKDRKVQYHPRSPAAPNPAPAIPTRAPP